MDNTQLSMSSEDFENAMMQAYKFGQQNGNSFGLIELKGIQRIKYQTMVDFMIATYKVKENK